MLHHNTPNHNVFNNIVIVNKDVSHINNLTSICYSVAYIHFREVMNRFADNFEVALYRFFYQYIFFKFSK